jgi:AcrR family transcriptional regulator
VRAPSDRSAQGSSFAAYRLPPGRHGIAPELIAENQRWRLLGAAAEVLAERGYARVTAHEIATGASVSSSTFYRYFDNVGACLLAAYEMTADCLCDLVTGACEGGRGEDWPARLRAALEEALAFLAAEPALASLLGAAVPAGDPAIAAARQRLISRLAWPLRGARRLRPEAAPALPPETERRLIAAALGLIGDRVAAGAADRLPELAPELAELLLPWQTEARRNRTIKARA